MYKELITIKGTRNGLVFYFNTKDAGFEEIKRTLIEKFESSKGFFQHAKFIVSPENRLNEEETGEIEAICTGYGLIKSSCRMPLHKSEQNQSSDDPEFQKNTKYYQAKSGAVLVNKTVRSGQKIYVTGHLVVLGDVNPGAEVIATGSVVVMGNLRGLVHAGAHGDDSVFILAHRLQPTQIRITDKVSRPPERGGSVDYPEVAAVVDGTIVVEPYQTNKRKAVNF